MRRSWLGLAACAACAALPQAAVASRADVVARVSRSVVLVETGSAQGSAFAFGRRGEYLTNAHVVEGATHVRVVTKDGRVASAEVVARDAAVDVARLRSSLVLPPLHAAPRPPRPGDDVLAIGAPRGLEGTVTQGIVSAVGRRVNGVAMIQTDVAVNPGSSGGPLLTPDGDVLGLTTAKAPNEEGIAFAVPIATATGTAEAGSAPPAAMAPKPAAGPSSGLGATWIAAIAAFLASVLALVAVLAKRILATRRSAVPVPVEVRLRTPAATDPLVVLRGRETEAPGGAPPPPGTEPQRRTEEQWT
jgi:Trypsin-like peptidase domain